MPSYDIHNIETFNSHMYNVLWPLFDKMLFQHLAFKLVQKLRFNFTSSLCQDKMSSFNCKKETHLCIANNFKLF